MGDAAPPLKVVKWLKGTPIEQFEPGKVYVLEFWATWCGPCKAAMPHVSELAKEYAGKITFIGVDVWEIGDNPLPDVEKFVSGPVGQTMQYNVAADEGGKAGFMATQWLDASASPGIPPCIPTTFVVDQTGKVAWIGHPNDLAEVLPKILDKTYDLATTHLEIEKQNAIQFHLNEFRAAVLDKVKAKDYAGAIAILDCEKDLPLSLQMWAATARFAALLHVDEKQAVAYANELFEQPHGQGNHYRRQVGQIIAEVGDSKGLALSKQTYAFAHKPGEGRGVGAGVHDRISVPRIPSDLLCGAVIPPRRWPQCGRRLNLR